jgi:hypothetical protein
MKKLSPAAHSCFYANGKGKFREFCELESAISQQNGNAIDDGIAPLAAYAAHAIILKL